MKNNITLIYNVCLVVGDFLALIAAFSVAYLLRVKFNVGLNPEDIGPSNGRAFLDVFIAVVPAWLVIFALLGLYNSNIYEKRFKEFGRLLIGSFIGMLIAIFWHFMAGDDIFPARLVPIYGFVFAFLFLLLFRNIARLVRILLFDFNIGLTKVLLVGNTSMTRELVTWLNARSSGYKVVGIIGSKRGLGAHNVPTYKTFAEFTAQRGGSLHGIIQTELYADEVKNSEILNFAQENHIGYRFVPGNTELFVGNIEVELFRSSIPVIAVHQTALFGWGRILKRLSDLAFGGLLVVLASPLMLAVAICIKLSGGGSIFFRQYRLTRFNHQFKIFKFRTQYAKYDGTTPEEAFAMMGKPELAEAYRKNGDFLANDPRVTPIGRLLRATSLDEIPQLFNVIRGDLSLVGPRALIPEELAGFKKRHTILSVKSGLTGLAQVSGRREISYEERRTLDVYYVQNWSVWLDLMIMAKTIRVVLGGRGAK